MLDLSSEIRALRGPIVITGAAGFVGANLFRKIFAIRRDVMPWFAAGTFWRLSDIPDSNLLRTDVNDPAAVKHLIDTIAPQTVMDCVAYGAYSFEQDPNLIYQTNFNSIVSLVSQLARQGISRSCMREALRNTETIAQPPRRCRNGTQQPLCGLQGRSRRVSAVYGQAAELPLREPAPVFCLRTARRRLAPDSQSAAQGTVGRPSPFVAPETSDFIHVDDVCAAFISAAIRMNPSLYGESFNIGSGKKTRLFVSWRR